MIEFRSIPAVYRPTGVKRYDGNPYIEALPQMEETKNDILDRIEYFPPIFTAKDRAKGELVRIAELARIGSIIYPFAEYRKPASNTTLNIREAYVSRNPCKVETQRRDTMIATMKDLNDEEAFRSIAFKSSALGQLIMAVSGSGKTTLGGGVLAPYCCVIEHTEYKGQPFRRRQIPVIPMSVLNNGSLMGFCIQFFETIDMVLGNTHYAREAKALRTIPLMTLLIRKVVKAVGLGLIFIDDVQNLRAVRGKQAEMVLDLFSYLLEIAGVSLLLSATPALEPVMARSVRNIRKLTTGGMSRFPVMTRHDPQWIALATAVWRYQNVKHPGPLTEDILDAWHACSGGNPAFTLLSFALAQRQEIGERETLDVSSFERVFETDMILLKPAIKALLSGKATDLQKFDDLVPKSGLMELLDQLGWARETTESAAGEPEFEELEEKDNEQQERPDAPARGEHKAGIPTRGKRKATPESATKGPATSKTPQRKARGLPSVKPSF
ncbi:AAA domain-containing protein [Variovorax sp. HW608]|uniref:ATP-binding protein n=1 Tax=Variovorax sp. HW608 TaxID=1034889 RepID=UPI00081FF37B|nr:ATP-binding protein [Variovorax sp. HW608]SCK42659.1 AAA domain-containing protein [Variovorax sp. HW608]